MDRTRAYWLASGAVLALFAAAGAWRGATPLAAFHAALAVAAFAMAFAPLAQRAARGAILAAATLFLAIAILGILSPRLFGYPARLGLDLRFGWEENLTHLALGIGAAYVGTNDNDA